MPRPSRCFKRALAIYEKAAGPEHLAVATLPNNLGQVAKLQGRYAEAEPEIKRSLAIREKVLGRDRPDAARSLNNLANLCERRAAWPMPSRSTSARRRSAKRTRSRSSQPRKFFSTIWPCPIRARDATQMPCRSWRE